MIPIGPNHGEGGSQVPPDLIKEIDNLVAPDERSVEDDDFIEDSILEAQGGHDQDLESYKAEQIAINAAKAKVDPLQVDRRLGELIEGMLSLEDAQLDNAGLSTYMGKVSEMALDNAIQKGFATNAVDIAAAKAFQNICGDWQYHEDLLDARHAKSEYTTSRHAKDIVEGWQPLGDKETLGRAERAIAFYETNKNKAGMTESDYDAYKAIRDYYKVKQAKNND